MFLLLLILITCPLGSHSYFQGVELLSDVNYTQGFSVIPACFINPDACAKGPQFRLYNPFSTAPNISALWQMAQWDSHSNISTNGTFVNDGKSEGMQWSSEDKRFILFQDDRLQISVNGYHEYQGKYRTPDEPWVALLLQQSIGKSTGSVSLNQVTELQWNLDIQLLYMDQHIQPGYNPNIHAGQFLLYMAIQNLVPGDPEYGKYFWLGICLYDDRFPMSPLYINGDKGTGSLIYQPAFSNFANTSVHSENVVHVSGNMRPFVRLGLEAAVERGFLNSTDLSKYYVGGMNIGWEVTGLNNGTIEIGNFSLKQYTAQNPKSYEFNQNGDTEGWKTTFNLNENTNKPLNGKWILSLIDKDSYLLSPEIMIDTLVVKKIIIRINYNKFQLLWSRSTEELFDENDSILVEMENDGRWKEYILDLSNNSNWYGIVRRLRIEPVREENNIKFGIDYIRFSSY
ncbi:unnamed protein product [Adineta steineri]|uniref:Uncharacterized protein n=1 Tax=Adineta steineri TaxID=433720 RepID=A0A816ALZ8_9BILA|nr:unnamed protein product [Adineta steineri]CAF1599906.1 unnamed protein product [Adineta steineri]